jgi:hypothetical protein
MFSAPAVGKGSAQDPSFSMAPYLHPAHMTAQTKERI